MSIIDEGTKDITQRTFYKTFEHNLQLFSQTNESKHCNVVGGFSAGYHQGYLQALKDISNANNTVYTTLKV
jgi:hypothetical protein